MPGPIRYAVCDGSAIAYQVIGRGPHDLVFVPGFVSQLELAWDEPFLARFLRELSTFTRLISFDKRGTGLSDPIPAEPSPEQRADEIIAVMDAAGSSSATVFGISEGASLALLAALRHPERVARIVTFAGFARLLEAPDHPFGWSEEFLEAFLDSFEEVFSTGEAIGFINPSLVGDERYCAWFARYLRAATSPGRARDLMRANAALDLRDQLPSIAAPALVLHRTDEATVQVEQSRYLASVLPHARLAELGGIDHWPWIGDSDEVIAQIELFVTGRRRPSGGRPAWGPDSLTRRERQVARLAVDGLTAAQIGERLLIGERTVESHIANVYMKLGVSSRLDLVRRAADLRV